MILEYVGWGILLTLMLGAVTVVLNQISIERNHRRQDIYTALFVVLSGTAFTVLLYLASSSGARLLGFPSYILLIKYSYGVGWRESFNIFSQMFVSALGLTLVAGIIISIVGLIISPLI
ncbi:MAG: hypothetical protein B6U72_06230 [Candidatus Altiarchaeales archaeon ex4484_2]|nr:MAG: hypothetical protein B6U72_06230 [Candidatus Altiarchaeales archaeon ex4484_2]